MKSFFLLLLLLPLAGRAQVAADSIAQRAMRALKLSRYPDDYDTTGCAIYIRRARQEQQAGKLCLAEALRQEYGLREYGLTHWVILAREYGIEYAPAAGDVVFESIICYNLSMVAAIEQKYGAGFLRRFELRTDSLVRLGQGFHPPRLRGKPTLADVVEQSFVYNSEFKAQPDKALLLIMEVDSVGHLKYLRVSSTEKLTLGSSFHTLPATHRYYREAARVLHGVRWQPATLYGRPINSQRVVLLNGRSRRLATEFSSP